MMNDEEFRIQHSAFIISFCAVSPDSSAKARPACYHHCRRGGLRAGSICKTAAEMLSFLP